jgi:hypothetical protein
MCCWDDICDSLKDECCCCCGESASDIQQRADQERRERAAAREKEESNKQAKIAQLKTEIWAFSHDQPLSETEEQRAERWKNLKKAVTDLSVLTGEPPVYPDMNTATARQAASGTATPSKVSTIYSLFLCLSKIHY